MARRRKRKNNQAMVVLIGILVVLLLVAVVVALFVQGGGNPSTDPSQTQGTGQTGATDVPTKPQPTAPKDVILAVSPEAPVNVRSGEILRMEVTAFDGSTVTAQLGSKTVTLRRDRDAAQSGYAVYTGAMAFVGELGSNLGQIRYTARFADDEFSKTSGDVTYSLITGDKYVAEVINFNAETFDGATTDDFSRPTNSYLPKGTVDYCKKDIQVNGSLKYVIWNFGMRTYLNKRNIPAADRTPVTVQYQGVLPDHNEMAIASLETQGHHTILTLDTLWKAPFAFDLLPQEYRYPGGGSDRNYMISDFTAEYVQLELAYTTSFLGSLDLPENSLFSSAEVIQNEGSCLLRLYLKKAGGFYGWDSYYNENGQLCFQFLNPTPAKPASNTYGADLTGITIYLDVGHGGVDGGSVGTDENGDRWNESGRNMDLALAVKRELESIGATVILNRDGAVAINVNDRNQGVHLAAPDMAIAIHHNASTVSSPNGFECFYYNAFSAAPANSIYKQTSLSGAYQKASVNWHNYFVSRETVCPVVLTENGYMSNLNDLHGTLSTSVVAKKAQAIAMGTAKYFLSIA